MASANQTLYRRFYREVFSPSLAPFGFERIGLQNVWRRDTSGGLNQLIGAAAGWLGGRRVLEWDIFIPGLDDLMRGDGPPLPFGGRVALGYCHVSGNASQLIQPEVLADHPELAGDFELPPHQTLEDRERVAAGVQSTLRLFAEHLRQLQTLENLLHLLTVDDPAGDHRFMPNRSLTPLYAMAVALLAKSPNLDLLASNLDSNREQASATWRPVVDRLLKAAREDRRTGQISP